MTIQTVVRDRARGLRGPGLTTEDRDYFDENVAEAKTARDEAVAWQASLAHQINFTLTQDWTSVIGYIDDATGRYTSAIDGNGYIEYTLTSPTGDAYQVGGRTRIPRAPLRTYEATFEIGTEGYNTLASGIGLGFDTSQSTGAGAKTAEDAGFLVVRNGIIQWEGPFGASSVPFSSDIDGGAGPVATTVDPQAGDVIHASLAEGEDGSAVLTLTSGATVATHTIEALPPGTFTPTLRMIGVAVTGAKGKIRSVNVFDRKTVIQLGVGATADPQLTPVPGRPASSPVDPYAYLPRRMPAGVWQPPLQISAVFGPGNVQTDRTAIEAFCQAHPEVLTGDVAYVAMSGNNSTGALNNAIQPFATLDYALNSTAARWVILENGVYSPVECRKDGAQAGIPKLVVARNPGRVVIRVPGDDIRTGTWTLVSGNAYERTIASGVGGTTSTVQRVMLTSGYGPDWLDVFGFPIRLPLLASAAAVIAAGYGWFYDTATDKLTVAVGGGSPEGKVRALYRDNVSAGNARILVYGAALGLDGLYLDGIQVWGLKDGTTLPEIWMSNYSQLCSPEYGTYMMDGGMLIKQHGVEHANAIDGTGTNYGTGAFMNTQVVGVVGRHTGDVMTFGTAISTSRQFFSSHSGVAIVAGCLGEANWGQEHADTTELASPLNLTMAIGNLYRGKAQSTARAALSFSGLGGATSGQQRRGYVDTCAFEDEGPTLLGLYDGAVGHIYNSPQLTGSAIEVSGSSLPTVYDPANP